MLRTVLIGLGILIVALVMMVVLQPSTFKISRSLMMSAPAAQIFPHVNDFYQWSEWSPWAKMDPDAKTIFEGPSSGVGSVFKWSGNDKVGVGQQTIVQSEPNTLIRIRLDFLKPFKATNTAEFTFEPSGSQTLVTWSMSGRNNIIGKAMSLVMNCDSMVGWQFEKGLQSLRDVVEKEE